MIKQNQKLINKALVFMDALVIITSFLFTWYVRVYSGIMDIEGGILGFRAYLVPVLVMVPIYILIYNFRRLYNGERVVFISKEIISIIKNVVEW